MNFMSGCVFFLTTCPQDKTIDGIQTDVLFLIGVDTHLERLPFLQLACVKKNDRQTHTKSTPNKNSQTWPGLGCAFSSMSLNG